MTFWDGNAEYHHSAEVYKIDTPHAAWQAEIVKYDDETLTSAWTTEAAAKGWVVRMLADRFGIDRKRLPWRHLPSEGFHKRLRVEWTDVDGTFKCWGWDL